MESQDSSMQPSNNCQSIGNFYSLYGQNMDNDSNRVNQQVLWLKNSNRRSNFEKQDHVKTCDIELEDQLININLQESDANDRNKFDVEPNPQSNISYQFSLEVPDKKLKAPIERKTKKIGSKPKNKGKGRRKNQRKTKKQRKQPESETKNIPKNYGKQIIKFIKTEKKLTQEALKIIGSKVSYEKLIQELKLKKKTLRNIPDLRNLWTQFEYSRQFRVLSAYFLRKRCHSWIFNSRIEKVTYPIKYRYKIVEGVQNPEEFVSLKEY